MTRGILRGRQGDSTTGSRNGQSARERVRSTATSVRARPRAAAAHRPDGPLAVPAGGAGREAEPDRPEPVAGGDGARGRGEAEAGLRRPRVAPNRRAWHVQRAAEPAWGWRVVSAVVRRAEPLGGPHGHASV